MAAYAEEGKPNGEAVDDYQQELQGDDAVDEAGEQFLGEDGVLFDELGEVVESGCWLEESRLLALRAGGCWGNFGVGMREVYLWRE